ncbi:MAG: hypothetical protein A2W93_14255 [Bacteroidetes bacterium GWF2_43_63]|nr:MAG: hypothetical protein A2W94_00825 [Bacteroidetes bacterium GWE2_42_42]OFY52503.1 MAG: hypothetical protein A2W93_14255 [Bacteroidetes bacterium GWF2_43_63]HBG71410.1 hypothetical protein [Bacteroidales bacterium]HCB60838.1 hypothetical protein [Bacteroidales bacterium]HCY23437.1 hypothetical protein [Bacteroidales bacterium]
MQAAVASLFELPLEDVPNFIEFENNEKYPDTNHFIEMHKFYRGKGYEDGITYINRKKDDSLELMIKIAKFDGGINGYLDATVKSQTFEDVYHSVVIDTDLNIVHDPNPNQLALKLTPDDVVGFVVKSDFIIGKTGAIFTQEEWGSLPAEIKDQNIWK